MANLTITECHLVRFDGPADLITGPAAETITPGQYGRYDTTTGQITKGNATTAGESRDGGVCIGLGGTAGVTVTLARSPAVIDVGNALSTIAYDADIYLSDTDGTLADTTGTVGTIVGTVIPAWGNTTADKLIQLKDL